MEFDPNKITFFAKTDARGENVPFGIKAVDRTKHMYVIGKTGMGKSTLLENMAVQDIRSGQGLAFIDPHGATAETLLDYIPEERKDDVLYFAPFDMEHPVSFNVMEDVGPDRRHLVVSGLMSVFEKIWVDAWSARMAYILQNTLMALLEYPDSTLLGVNRVLSDKNYRNKVVDNIKDPSVKSFWIDEFAKYNERYMQEAGDAIKNKIGQFTANPLIRNIIGQPKSSFDLRKIMDDQKILIMNLSKGLVGESNANLLGSMLTTRIYLAAMSRADLTQDSLKRMPNFYFYVDEFQSFANATFADILSEARKYKLNLTIAHQYIEQMEEEVKNAVFGNVGTIIAFRVGPFDAEILETIFAPQFQAIDIVNLGFAQVYMTLMIDGVGSQPFSATTLPPLSKPSISCCNVITHASRMQYARPRAEVETEIINWHERQHASEMHPQGNGEQAARFKKPQQGAQQNNRRNEGEQRQERRAEGANVKRFEAKERERQESQHARKTESSPQREKRNGKDLDDLRAVLARISTENEEKNTVLPEEKPKEVQNVIQQPQKQKEQPSTDGHERNTVDLKDALRKALEHTAEDPQHNRESAPETQKNDGVAESHTPHKETTTDTEPHQKDALDPKKLERMMRVTTSDKTPLK